jgi:hypothetical protein
MKSSRQTIKAGKKGTKKFVDKYGPSLLYVRYYYDIKRQKRITTVELLLDEKSWVPKKINPNKLVHIKVQWGESEIAQRIKQSGGKWIQEKKVWEIPFGKVKELGIQNRMTEE